MGTFLDLQFLGCIMGFSFRSSKIITVNSKSSKLFFTNKSLIPEIRGFIATKSMNFVTLQIGACLGLGMNTIKLGQLFAGALFTPSAKDIDVDLQEVKVVYSGGIHSAQLISP